MPRKKNGKHYIVPLHADIQVRSRTLGLDCLTPIIWHKITNGMQEAAGNGAGYYGKPYQPGGVVKNDIEYILFLALLTSKWVEVQVGATRSYAIWAVTA